MKRKSKNKSPINNYPLAIINWKWVTYLLLIVTCQLSIVSCGSKESTHEHDTYTCPMHPTVISDVPGKCPVCAMDLVRKARPGEEIQITEDLARLMRSPNEIVIGSIETIKPQYKSLPVSIEAQGVVTYDTRQIQSVSARVSGRVEKLYVKYLFQPISQGQRMAEVYSPELITAQRELIFLLENDAANENMIKASKDKLTLLGLNAIQLSNLISTRVAKNTFTLYSPYDGYLVNTTSSSAAIETANSEMASGMQPVSSSKENYSEATLIRQGNYVSYGQTLFTIVRQNAFRVEIDLPSAKSGTLKKGDSIFVDYENGIKEKTLIDFVQPFFTSGENFTKIRIIPKTKDELHIGHLVAAHIPSDAVESIWLPKEAVLDLGNDKVVFIKERNVFKARKVTVGTTSDELIEIKSGLASSDEIAKDAHYLVDSESFIKTVQ